jgi:hypothetical protein
VSKVIEWDDATFSDCRPSEARDSMDEHIRAAKRYDCSDKLSDEVDGGNEATHQQLGAVGSFFDTVGEANEAAKQCMVKMLELEVEGDRRILTAVRAVTDAEWSTGFKPPPSSKNPAEALGWAWTTLRGHQVLVVTGQPRCFGTPPSVRDDAQA